MTPSLHAPLRPVDTDAADDYWRSFERTRGLSESLWAVGAVQFGDSYELANELADLVGNGPGGEQCERGTMHSIRGASHGQRES